MIAIATLLIISLSVHPIDWKAIRSLNGAQYKGFEELCVQLARASVPENCEFTRNGTPDGGVECYARIRTDEEWGWQSKYVHSIDKSQWSQIDDSVKTALRTHPHLTRYYVCMPLDLPDARQENKESARDRWNRSKTEWVILAGERGMAVEFVLWDSSELLNRLSLPCNAGRVLFWFGSPGYFDRPWFDNQVASAAQNASPRYTPELHVELPISNKFEAFGRTEAMVDRVRGTSRGLHEEYKSISRWADSEEAPALGAACQPLTRSVEALMASLDKFTEQPAGTQGLTEIGALSKRAIDACDAVYGCLQKIDEHHRSVAEAEDETTKGETRQRSERQTGRYRTLRNFEAELRSARAIYAAEEGFAEAQIFVLMGEAGSGKTHLLCDLAKQRIAQNRPTVLLLGQCFTTTDPPARQVANLLDFPNASLTEIVGCLEAAAQAANARCLILIDALNEGMGRHIWATHLTDFVEKVKASPWLAIVLSVRTCYTKSVVPDGVFNEAAKASHCGFEEVQQAAVKFFFLAHGLEFASVPVFSREFSNPLFLKTLCRGLKRSGYRMLPRGFHGITKVFGLYLEAMESDLAQRLDYSPKQQLVRKALQALVDEAARTNQQFLLSERGCELINSLLPGRDYSKSLYKALLDEGLIMESPTFERDGIVDDVVSIAYERWADHLAAKALLDAHLDPKRPAEAFKRGGPLALYGNGFSMREGLREALSIQLPERVGRELLSLAPYGLTNWSMADAFLHSVVWRDPEACTPAMERLLNYIEARRLSSNVWDTRITVATIPGHALNMASMDRWLKKTPMPERDADWTITIHKAWDQVHSICRLVDWAWGLQRGAPLEEDSAWLAALTLCWCFTSSNRFLRDRATKAAVNLLDDRVMLVARLVRHFADVDDLYVQERILAVACGVALRSYDAREVTSLAEAVHETVFAAGTPPAHILLRDYARAVIERSVYLGGKVTFDAEVANPPYRSGWPTIPSKEEVEGFFTDWQQIGRSLLEEEWAKQSMLNSVMENDFARYVIGTNHGTTDWLSLSISEPPWASPSQRIDALIETLSRKQQQCWKLIEKLRLATAWPLLDDIALIRKKKALKIPKATKFDVKLRKVSKRKILCAVLMKRLGDSLPVEIRDQLNTLIAERDQPGGDQLPHFDLSLIQRYIAKRVFELGWTVDRFGGFDRHYIRNRGRDAAKAERIGKKYQWIAYHEISALVADHFQYHEDRWMNVEQSYEGPWQGAFRDIDPTHCIYALPERGKGHEPWWEPICYTNWQSERVGQEWVSDASDFPDLSRLLRVTDRHNVRWINAYGFYRWERKRLPSQDHDDAEKRYVWTKFHAWFVKRKDAKPLLDWAAGIDVGEKWMPHQLPLDMRVFLGEHGWAKASRFHEHAYFGHDGWHIPGKSPVKVFSIPVEYLEERGTFDCSMNKSFSLMLPAPELTRELDLRWTGKGADFNAPTGELFATDPSAHEAGRQCLLLREDLLWRYLDCNELSVVWAVTGEKNCYGPTPADILRFSGAWELTRDGLSGEVRKQDY